MVTHRESFEINQNGNVYSFQLVGPKTEIVELPDFVSTYQIKRNGEDFKRMTFDNAFIKTDEHLGAIASTYVDHWESDTPVKIIVKE